MIGSLLLRLRATAFKLERVAFRLERLQIRYDRGVGQGTLEDGTTTKEFFSQIEHERKDVAHKLAITRRLTRQYVKRNEGHLP